MKTWIEILAEEKFKSLPKGWTEDSLNKFIKTLTGKTKGDPKGMFDACVKKIGETDIDDPKAFCGALKARFVGKGEFKQ